MGTLKQTLHEDLIAAMRSRDAVTTATLRMALTAITTEEVAGSHQRELTDADVQRVLAKEAKKRREAVAAYTSAARPERADDERAELAVLEGYLPTALTDEELDQLVRQALETTGATVPNQMGQVMKVVQPMVAGRADGARVAAAVRAALAP
ncbi:MAG: GatB/YqeY domain-containing protein [Dermatophilaceae bacterium]